MPRRNCGEIRAEDAMPCPFCRSEFSIPKEGLTGLKKSFFIERLVEETKMYKHSQETTPCEICTEEKADDAVDTPSATSYCIQCQKNICNLCCREHKKFRELRQHQLVEMGSQVEVEEELMKLSAPYCKRHQKEIVKMYCTYCKEVICMRCFAESHQMHKCSDIEKVADEFRDQFKVNIGKLDGCSSEADAKSNKIKIERMNFVKQVENTKQAIIGRGEEIKAFVDRCTQSLLTELESVSEKRMKDLGNSMEENDRHKRIIKSFKAYCTEIRNRGSTVDICRSIEDLDSRTTDLLEMHQTHTHQEIPILNISFKASDIEDSLRTGTIISNDNKVSIQQIHTFNINRNIWGVSKLQGDIHVLCCNPNSILVFEDQDPFHLLEEIKLETIDCPCDIGSCEKSECLWIISRNGIWKIERNKNDRLWVIKRMIDKISADCMSVCSDGHLLVYKGYGQSQDQLEIYDGSSARLIRTVPLPNNFTYIIHAVQKPTGDFIVIRSLEHSYGPWGISQLTSNGEIVNHFSPTDDSQNLNWPASMCLPLDTGEGRLFVADNDKQRVVIFDSDSLRWRQILREGEEIDWPAGLHYDVKTKQLLVGLKKKKVPTATLR